MAIDTPSRGAPAGGEDELAEGHMTLMDHIAELRTRIIRSLVAFAVAALVAWFLYDHILHFLLGPLRANAPTGADLETQLVTLDPLEPFQVRIRLTTYVGLMLAMPVILWQLWRFVAPGLYSNEKKYAVSFVVAGSALFAMGAAIAFWTVPMALQFLEQIGGEGNFEQFYSPSKYLQLIVYMMLAFGIGFEFPILLIFLQLAGLITSQSLRNWRRYAYVIIALVVGIGTPSGDPISMLALTVPMILFYEAAILFGRLRERRLRRAAEEL